MIISVVSKDKSRCPSKRLPEVCVGVGEGVGYPFAPETLPSSVLWRAQIFLIPSTMPGRLSVFKTSPWPVFVKLIFVTRELVRKWQMTGLLISQNTYQSTHWGNTDWNVSVHAHFITSMKAPGLNMILEGIYQDKCRFHRHWKTYHGKVSQYRWGLCAMIYIWIVLKIHRQYRGLRLAGMVHVGSSINLTSHLRTNRTWWRSIRENRICTPLQISITWRSGGSRDKESK